MIKKIFFILLGVLVGVYLVLALTVLNREPVSQICQGFELLIEDQGNGQFVTKEEMVGLLEKKKLYPVGKRMEDIRTDLLEAVFNSYQFIESSECYKSPSGTIYARIRQRVPVLRVMNNAGENFYVDDKAGVMPVHAGRPTHLVVVTGFADKAFVLDKVYPLGVYLMKDKFWNAQIEQINVTSKKEIELVPRVGEHIVFLGTVDHFEEKLDRLKLFYEKALNKVGWNKYERISLEFGNQVICTKKD